MNNIEYNKDLISCNTMRLHAVAEYFIEPESIDELKDVYCWINKKSIPYYILGGGSNIIMPPLIKGCVISLMKINNTITFKENRVVCGASVRIQKLVKALQENNLGGIEYLYSVPASIGGSVYMNAGRGNRKDAIGNYVESVECYDLKNNTIKVYSKEDCHFSYRTSVFQQSKDNDSKDIILSVTFKFPSMDRDESIRRAQERLQYSREKLDPSHPSCGSVFNLSSARIMNLLMGLKHGGARFSNKKNNWISNMGNATSNDVRWLIKFAVFLHRITFRPYKIEVELW